MLVPSSACSPEVSVASGLVSACHPSEASSQVKSCAKTVRFVPINKAL